MPTQNLIPILRPSQSVSQGNITRLQNILRLEHHHGQTGTSDTTPQTPTQRTVTITGGVTMRIIDDDSTFWGHDFEVGQLENQIFQQTLSGNNLIDMFPNKVKGYAGDEVRVELQIQGSIANAEGDVLIIATALLFEGTNRDTDELDGTASARTLLPYGRSSRLDFTVRNEDEGGDYAEISIALISHPI